MISALDSMNKSSELKQTQYISSKQNFIFILILIFTRSDAYYLNVSWFNNFFPFFTQKIASCASMIEIVRILRAKSKKFVFFLTMTFCIE